MTGATLETSNLYGSDVYRDIGPGSQGSFTQEGRDDILAVSIGRPEHPGYIRGVGRGPPLHACSFVTSMKRECNSWFREAREEAHSAATERKIFIQQQTCSNKKKNSRPPRSRRAKSTVTAWEGLHAQHFEEGSCTSTRPPSSLSVHHHPTKLQDQNQQQLPAFHVQLEEVAATALQQRNITVHPAISTSSVEAVTTV
ncbi:hypothetical protein LR48_Vigan715s000700 [Vigna angularis]|uniref:Uncharacterized protein n=1 Tax=Phaseolus angularis TaxID=3914 RepID=A0A0L9TGE9_PHAAN|nr:hypothetical protein LR48_Vigan715s000700 [Vigna angularis]